MPPVEPRPRRVGRISTQAKQYLATARQVVADEISWILDCFAAGDRTCWDLIPMDESRTRPGRMVVLLTSGDVLVWQPYGDYPDLYAVFYVGPASAP